jgi:hypothetical protein
VAWFAFISTSAVAKGPVDRIEIFSAGITREVDRSEGLEVGEFDPWSQFFLGERLGSPPSVSDAATVTMYLTDETARLQPIYRFSYFASATGGYIYLPGRGDADYELNKTTIITANDGTWFRASANWDAFVAAANRVRPPATGDGGLK